MAQTACFTNIFTISDFALASKNALRLQGGIGEWNFDHDRPFIPISGAILNANGVYVPDSIANNKLFIATFVDFYKECRQASINMVQGVPGSTYQSELYQGYLYKKTFADANQFQRYLEIIGIVFEFWNTADAAWTTLQYYDALTKLATNLSIEADKNLYIPPGVYQINPLSALSIDLDAWKAGNASFVAMLVLEFYQ